MKKENQTVMDETGGICEKEIGSRISPGVNDCSHVLAGTFGRNGLKSMVHHSVVDHRLDSTTPERKVKCLKVCFSGETAVVR